MFSLLSVNVFVNVSVCWHFYSFADIFHNHLRQSKTCLRKQISNNDSMEISKNNRMNLKMTHSKLMWWKHILKTTTNVVKSSSYSVVRNRLLLKNSCCKHFYSSARGCFVRNMRRCNKFTHIHVCFRNICGKLWLIFDDLNVF